MASIEAVQENLREFAEKTWPDNPRFKERSEGAQLNYQDFISSKRVCAEPVGLSSVPSLSPHLFGFQRAIVEWALKRGRAAIWADCGMGKTPIQIEWAKHVPGPVLILAPIAVAVQTVREGEKFGIPVIYSRDGAPRGKITITNYEMFHHFDPADYTGVVLDESSILKSYMGKTKRALLESFKNTPFRLACTATPAPNDNMELGNHAEFLGVMDSNEMLARWFINDSMHAGNYKIKAHGAKDFWMWVSSWAVALTKPSDIGDFDDSGFLLPPINIDVCTVKSAPPPGQLFHTAATLSATEIHQVKRETAPDRAQAVADFANAQPDVKCLIWCDTNYEADEIKQVLPHAVDVRGSDSAQTKEQALLDFAEGDCKVLITKPSVAGFGMNFQKCHRIAFVGLSYSFESEYQAIRRVWRFGQEHPVECLLVEGEAEVGIRGVVERKIEDHRIMQAAMIDNMREWQKMDKKELRAADPPVLKSGKNWQLWLGDCVDVLHDKIEDESLDFSIFSPPFSNLYIYSDSLNDMGNSADHSEFFEHMKYMIKDLLRATVNGRLCAVHCKDLPAYMGRDGAAGLIDFPGQCISAFEAAGWQYHSRVTIWKDPVTEMQRTKNHGLLHKQLCKDSSASRQGMADYLIVFRKWGGGDFEKPVHGPSNLVRFDSYVGEDEIPQVKSERDMSIQVWQRYASPVWFDIKQQRVLQGSRHATSDDDERHICPLQLDVIERAIHLWTNVGDVVFSPFTGIGSEGHVALSMERKFIGAELKESYFNQAITNLESAHVQSGDLFAENIA